MNGGICKTPTEEDNGVLCEECADLPRFRYYALLRPPGYAAVPDGWCLREFWNPPQLIKSEPLYFHGWIEYPEPLPIERAWKFDLVPSDETLRESYNRYHKEMTQ